MGEPIDWLPDGTPYSPRFGDRYHSENGGLDQARRVFLHGCGLPTAWAGQAHWRILETGFGFGLNFLVTWAAWRADPQRPTLLHFVSTEAWPVSAADLLRATQAHPDLAPLGDALHRQWWGLLPGVHRLRFDEGRVLLTLYIGDTQTQLRQQHLTVDSIYLDGFCPQRNPDIWNLHTLKAVARCCRRGTTLATWTIARAVRDALTQCGFEVTRAPGVPPKRDNLHAVFNPPWEPRHPRKPDPTAASASLALSNQPVKPGACLVIGAGIAGAAAAASLARRGWQVTVVDQGATPAAGASALPAGVFAPHVSPDDSVLSRLSRAGVRTTLEQARWLLEEGVDWSHCGVLEHRTDGTPGLSADWHTGPGTDWSLAAAAQTLAQAGLPPTTTACWHGQAGWIRPPRLAAALLAQPHIQWQGDRRVAALRRMESDPAHGLPTTWAWQALDAHGNILAEAPTLVIAAGAGSLELLEHRWPLQPVRGQVSWGVTDDLAAPVPPPKPIAPSAPLAPFPVNGNGNLVPHFAQDGGSSGWVMGSTFERDVHTLPPSPTDVRAAHAANWAKLQALLPEAAPRLEPLFARAMADSPQAAARASSPGDPPAESTPCPQPRAARHWAAVRCTAPDRLPIVGPVDAAALPGLWVCTAMGARGLTLALLCGELLAARLQGEPLPIDAKLARSLSSERL